MKKSHSPTFSRFAGGLASLAAFTTFAAAALTDAPPSPGLANEPPADVRSVKVDDGYIVPYKETIPGTEITFEMVPVAGGEFLLGSPKTEAERAEDEGPQVKVKVEPYWIGKCEVTWGEYREFMAMYDAFKKMQLLATNRDAADADAAADEAWGLVQAHAWNGKVEEEWDVDAVTSATPLYDPSFTYSVGDKPNQPAVTMTQFAAKQYTKWLSGITGRGYRLPTEAEWEYAARAGTTGEYSFGVDAKDLDAHAWYDENADYQTHPVGEKKPNAWGLHDVHGNVAEWTLDEYLPDAYVKLGAESVDTESAVRWPTKLYPRVVRGGSWLDLPPACRSASRQKSEEDEWKLSDPNIPLSPWWFTEEAASGVGMRIVRPLTPLTDDEKRRVWEADVDDVRQDVRDRLREGRGVLGIADQSLPAAVKAAEKLGE